MTNEKSKSKWIKIGIEIAVIALLYVILFIIDKNYKSVSLPVTVTKKALIYSLVAVSLNLLNGFTGLFSLGQAGFMLLGAYTYGVLTIPVEKRAGVYYLYDGGVVNFEMNWILALVCAGVVCCIFAYLIGLPVLKLKSDYLAIATLGFAEILRALVQWEGLAPLTNGSISLNKFYRLSSVTSYGIIVGVCILIIVLLINSTYGRALKAIRDDEVAAEAMGINLAKHKRMSFMISSFFAGIAGGLLAMYQSSVTASQFTSAFTYEILLIVVIGGIGSITGSIIGAFIYIFSSEWILRDLDSGTFLGITAPTLFRSGFRLVVFSVIIMMFVLFFRKGIMGRKELNGLGIFNFFAKTLPHFFTQTCPKFFHWFLGLFKKGETK